MSKKFCLTDYQQNIYHLYLFMSQGRVYDSSRLRQLPQKIQNNVIKQLISFLFSKKFQRIYDASMSSIIILIYIVTLVNYFLDVSKWQKARKIGIIQIFDNKQSIQWLFTIDIIMITILITQYIIKFYLQVHKLSFLFSLDSFFSFLSFLPMIKLIWSQFYVYKLVNLGRTSRLYRLSKWFKQQINISGRYSSVQKQFANILITLFTLFIMSTGILYSFQNYYRLVLISKKLKTIFGSSLKILYYNQYVYFVLVTLSTVGFGDIVAISQEGRIVVICLISIFIVIVPMQTNQLIRLMQMQSIYARNHYKQNPQIPHLLISGTFKLNALKSFCKQLFHSQHGSQLKNLLILMPSFPQPLTEIFLHDPQYQMFLTYIQGSPFQEKDLSKTSIKSAKACIIMPDQADQQPTNSDYQSILATLSIVRYVKQKYNRDLRTITMLLKSQSKTHYLSCMQGQGHNGSNNLLVVQQLKMNLFAKSCFCPGIISLISNLIISYSQIDQKKYPNLCHQNWFKQYTQGLTNQIYRTKLSPKFQGRRFSQVASTVYNNFKVVMFAIQLNFQNFSLIRLNPGDYIIPDLKQNNIKVYLICRDKSQADMVASYDINHEQNQSQDDSQDLQCDQFQQQEDLINQKDYHILKKQETATNHILKNTIQNSTQVTNHIVVCGAIDSLLHFILPLRARYLKTCQWIVVLSQTGMTLMQNFRFFPNLCFIKGSGLVSIDLIRANIMNAQKAVILSKERNQFSDSQSFFIYKAIKSLNKQVQIFVDLALRKNLDFFLQKQIDTGISTVQDYQFTNLFAAGQCYIQTIADSLMSQAYFNQHIISIIMLILCGSKQSNSLVRIVCQHAELKQSNLFQIQVPLQFVGKSFGQLFTYLANQQHSIAVAIYRLKGSVGNKCPFTYTCPKSQTKLTHRDMIFILAFQDGGIKSINKKKILKKNYSFHNDGLNRKKSLIQPINQSQERRVKNGLHLQQLNGFLQTHKLMQRVKIILDQTKLLLNDFNKNLQQQNEIILQKMQTAIKQQLIQIKSKGSFKLKLQ